MVIKQFQERLKVGDIVAYREGNHQWYFGEVGSLSESSSSRWVDVLPMDERLVSKAAMRFWGYTSPVYPLPKEVLTGEMSPAQIKAILVRERARTLAG